MLAGAAMAYAAVPFVTTTVSDGKFADDTRWYCLRIHSNGYYLSATEPDANITLGRTASDRSDSDMWCFAGNDADGYTLYNKAVGAEAMLAAPSSPENDGDNGGASVAQVKKPGASGYSYAWECSPSANISGKDGFYLNIKGKSAAKLNRRGTNLAFWTSGADGGSTIYLESAVEAAADGETVTFATEPATTLTCPGGTATAAGGIVTISAGKWTFAAPEGKSLEVSLKIDGVSTELTAYPHNGSKTLAVEGPAVLTDVYITVRDLIKGYPVFPYTGAAPYNVQYRIPAITCIPAGPHAGRLVAVNDYRYSGADIGAGRIDLHMAVSDDNGITWSDPYDPKDKDGNTVAVGSGKGASNSLESLDCGYGDPALVADRETGELLMVACCGRTGFFSGVRQSPQPSARWWSQDGGQTWTAPDYGQWEQIYALFDGTSPYGYIDSQFIGSGRIMQSRYIKVGDYYRIYAVMSGMVNLSTGGRNISNWVLYSDDFGRNWHVLGDPMQPAVSSAGDEPKAEELPDGSVLLAARRNGGNRNFNIFRYTDVAKAEGSWGTSIGTNMGMGGINGCNGEIMILPVENLQTGDRHYIALQSFPYGGSRKDVSIAYKALVTPDDYDQPNDFATWDGRYQVSNIGSAYSTMTWTADNKVGFFYEEETYGLGYTEIYIPLTIEEITGGIYKYVPDSDLKIANRMAKEMMDHRNQSSESKYVGQPLPGNSDAVNAAIAAFEADPSIEAIAAFNSAISSGVIKAEAGAYYRFTSAHDGAYTAYTKPLYLATGKTKTIKTTTKLDNSSIFQLAAADNADEYYIVHPDYGHFFPSTHSAIENTMKCVDDKADAATYKFKSSADGHTAIVCLTPGNASYPALHLKSSGGTVVIWTQDAGGSQWYMEPVTDYVPEASIEAVKSQDAQAPAFDLQGRRTANARQGQLYVQGGKIIKK